MPSGEPFILLDDARSEGAVDAHLFERPSDVFVARRPEEVARVLQEANAAREMHGGTLAGYIAYEAGLALEPRLQPLAARRIGGDGPLVWFGLFDHAKAIPAAEVPQWLAERAGGGLASIGPLEPQITPGAYVEAFDALQEAIRAGDIYQANLTFRLAGAARGDPVAIYRAIRPAANAGYGGLLFDGERLVDAHRPGHRDPREVVAHQVDDHQVLRLILERSGQLRRERAVLRLAASARSSNPAGARST